MDAAPPDFEVIDFSWDGSHGHIVSMLHDRHERGIVVDIGCGSAPHAEPLRDAGFVYVGLDVNPACVDALRGRGFDAGTIDLRRADDVDPMLDEAVTRAADRAGEHAVVAVLALDVVEHLVDPHLLLAHLHAWMTGRSVPVLGLSVPNVSHRDLAVRLLGARWDMTPTGLLDATHLRFFTDRTLTSVLSASGFDEVDRRDAISIWSDQHSPVQSPLLNRTAPAGRFLADLRDRADGHGDTYQFVRLYAPGERAPAPSMLGEGTTEPDAPRVAVVAAAECGPDDVALLGGDLAAQTSDRWQLLDADALDSAAFTHVSIVGPGQRLGPSWVEQFVAAAGEWHGMVLRCRPNAAQEEVGSGWPVEFDPIDHRIALATPPAALAFPLAALDVLGLTLVDDHPDTGVDAGTVHQLLVFLAPFCGVHDTGHGALTATSPWHEPGKADSGPTGRETAGGETVADAPVLVEPWVLDELAVHRQRRGTLDAAAASLDDSTSRIEALERDNQWLNAELRRTPVRIVRRLLRRPGRDAGR
ncbi:MAG: methyltransferase domain-containing protein [Ilumatobacter sp.]|nr:methyltransferase domain-containing protein [Ilumatobacter sp.]